MPLSEWPAYAVLAEVSLGYPPQQGRFPRATHPCATRSRRTAFDLHVLSMPPAFVLSQDQTLMFNPNKPTALKVIDPQTAGPSSSDPCPAQRPDPIRAIKRSQDTVTPPKASQPQTKPYLAARPTALGRRPRIPSLFIM